MNTTVSFFLIVKQPRFSRLIMGIPAYGIGFRLSNPNENGVGAPASSGGTYYPFHDICALVNSGSLNDQWDDAQKVPYAFRGNEWIGSLLNILY